MKKIKIAPSILSADFSRLGEQVAAAAEAGADYIHVDVMDGRFVPNITIGAPVVASLRRRTELPLDVHLMIEDPDSKIPDFVKAGANIITVHYETCTHLHRTVQSIKDLGVRAGVSINPATPADMLEEILPDLDLVLVMTVNPGFGGQSFISGVLPKVKELKKKFNGLIQIDGGINNENAKHAIKAGADVLVAGTYIFKSKDIKEAIKSLKG